MKKPLFLIFVILIIIFAAGLRLVNLGKFPPNLYWEETALGYDAYSILKTGRDFHGNLFPIVAFKSFGDYKPSGYFYAVAISEFFLGLNEFAVRLPSALAGIGIVILGMLIAKEIFGKEKQKNLIVLISGLIIALSPWALQFSRASFEANLAAFFSCLGIWILFKSQKKSFYLLPAAIAFTASIYTYHSSRIFIPLLLVVYTLLFWRVIKKQWKWVIASALLGGILVLPIILKIKDPQISRRFQETSAFTEIEPIIKINQLREVDGNTLLSRMIHHRYWYYSSVFLRNLFSHFDPSYLFINGDENLRHSTRQTGIFYPIDVVFLLIGLVFLLGKARPFRKDGPFFKKLFLLLWWILALVPAALTKAVPHALRTLLAVPAPQLIISYGAVSLFYNFKKRTKPVIPRSPAKCGTTWESLNDFKVYLNSRDCHVATLLAMTKKGLVVVCITIYIFFVSQHFYDYFGDYNRRASSSWQYGYKQMIEYVFQNKEKYEKIYITRLLGRPSIYYWFFTKTDPKKVQAEETKALKDQGERLSFENIIFGMPGKISTKQKVLLIPGSEEKLNGNLLWEIKDYQGKTIFKALEI